MFADLGKAMPTAKEAKRAVALRDKMAVLGKKDPEMAKFFGLGGFSKAIQESMGKPNEQKARDEKRDVILKEQRDNTKGIWDRLEKGLTAAFS